MKKYFLTLAALCGFFIAQKTEATCSNYTAYSDGQILNASSLNGLQTNYTNCINDILNGDTFTGNISLYSGSDLFAFSDTGTTETVEILGETGAASFGLRAVGIPINLTLVNATTSTTDDSVKIQCGSSACSATNPGFITLLSTTSGQMTLFKVTSDVTIKITGASFDLLSNLTGVLLKVFAVNDAGTLKWCVGRLGRYGTVTTSNTTATPASANLSDEYLCNSAISGSNTIQEIGYVRGDFTVSGAVWDLQTGTDDIVTGQSSDGIWQPYSLSCTGFSAAMSGTLKWTQIGYTIHTAFVWGSGGTSNSTSFSCTLPAKAKIAFIAPIPVYTDNSVAGYNGYANATSSSTTIDFLRASGASWTNSGTKNIANMDFTYEAEN